MSNPSPGRLREFAALLTSSTVYVATGLATGGVVALLSGWFGIEPYKAFLFGFFIPPGPLYLLFTSKWMMTRRLRMMLDWKESGLIQSKEYDRLRKEALRWYAERAFGMPIAEPGRQAQEPEHPEGNS